MDHNASSSSSSLSFQVMPVAFAGTLTDPVCIATLPSEHLKISGVTQVITSVKENPTSSPDEPLLQEAGMDCEGGEPER